MSEPIHMDLRVCSTPELLALMRKPGSGARTTVTNILSDRGGHVLRRRFTAPQSPWHRVVALCNLVGTNQPAEVMFEVLDDDWRKLATVDEVTG